MAYQTVTFQITGTASQDIEIINPNYSLEDIQKGLRSKKLGTTFFTSREDRNQFGIEDKDGHIVARLGGAKVKYQLDNGLEFDDSLGTEQIIAGRSPKAKKKLKP